MIVESSKHCFRQIKVCAQRHSEELVLVLILVRVLVLVLVLLLVLVLIIVLEDLGWDLGIILRPGTED